MAEANGDPRADPLWPNFLRYMEEKYTAEVELHNPVDRAWATFKAGADAQKDRVSRLLVRHIREGADRG